MNYRIFLALMHKECFLILRMLPIKLIDSVCALLCNVLLYGYLMPFIGMSRDMIIPTFLGSIMLTLILLNYTQALRTAFDQEIDKFIYYQYSLPIPGRWVMTAYVSSCMIHNALIVVPLLAVGLFLLRASAQFSISIGAVALIGLLCLIFQALFFTWVSFQYSLHWFLRNAWARRIAPLLIFSALLFTWKSVFLFSPTLACFMLLNPFTLMIEGLRGALLGFDNFVPYWYCIIMLIGYCTLMIYGLRDAIYKKLDPVLL